MTKLLAPNTPWQRMSLQDALEHFRTERKSVDPLQVFAAQWVAKHEREVGQGETVEIPDEALGVDPLTGRQRTHYAAKKVFKHEVYKIARMIP